MRLLLTTALIISTSLLTPLDAPENRWNSNAKLRNSFVKTDMPVTTPIIKSYTAPVTAPVTVPVVAEPKGRWVTVIATGYSPNDAIDKNSRFCQDDFTASMTRVSANPYAVAVPMRRDRNGRSTIPVLAGYGASIYIPVGHGYLDNVRKEDRIFTCDDTGGIINSRTRKTGIPHIDLRFKTEAAAKKFGKKKIEVFVYED